MKITLEINFMHLGDSDCYCSVQTFSIISALFSTKCLFLNFIFYFSQMTRFSLRMRQNLNTIPIVISGLRCHVGEIFSLQGCYVAYSG
jgi:hypothetical protein